MLTLSNYNKLNLSERTNFDSNFLKMCESSLTKKQLCEKLECNIKVIDYLIKKYNKQRKSGPKINNDKLSKYFSLEEEKLMLEHICEEFLINNLSIPEVCEKLHIKRHIFEKFKNKYNIKKSRENINKTYERLCLKKRGVKHSSQDTLVQEKSKKTCLKKYGVENPFQSEEVKEKIKQNNIKKYGVEYSTQRLEIKEKILKTQREKYGNEIGFNSKKAKENRNLKYGVDYPMQSEEIKNNWKLSIQKKYNKTANELNELDYLIAWRQMKRGINSSKFSDEFVLSTLINKEKFKTFILSLDKSEQNILSIAEMFNVGPSYIYKYAIKHDLRNYLYDDYYSSTYEQEIFDTLSSMYDNAEIHNRKLIEPLELDFVFNNVAIEFNGTWHHSYENKSKYYHQYKSKLCEEKGIRLIHIWEYEWNNKTIKTKLLSLLDDNKIKIYGRNLKIKEVSKQECDEFLNLYHLQNTCRGQLVKYGLYLNDELIQVMTFGKPRYNKNYEWELLRLCTHKDYKVIGGSERLWKHFLREQNPKNVISYCDFSKFSGGVYERLGMKLIKLSSPNKIWVKHNKTINDSLLNQLGFDKLFNTDYGKGTSNKELMKEHGWLETFDSGNKIFEWEV